jgi:hypothetical protein
MPYGDFINNFPPGVFLLVHLAAFLVGAFLAHRSFEAGASLAGTGFFLFALAEVCYMIYHLDWTMFLFAHTISEALDLAAFVLAFAGVVQLTSAGQRHEVQPEAVTQR